MTFALTSFEAYAVEADEPLAKKFIQRVRLKGTAANTNVAYDFGTYAGTFWTAVGSTSPGTTALATFKAIQLAAASFLRIQGTALAARSMIGSTVGGYKVYDSAVYAGGSATPTLTVTGLLAADTIESAVQRIKNANSLPLLGWTDGSRSDNAVVVAYSADPGNTGVVRFFVQKAAVAPIAGQYEIAMDGTNTLLPNLSFFSTDGPTAYDFTFEWELAPGTDAFRASASA